MPENEMKRCPFCGEAEKLHIAEGGNMNYGFCDECLSEGPGTEDGRQSALTAWNARVPAQSAGGGEIGYKRAMDLVEAGWNNWASKEHNKKWVRKIDGTPIPNDVRVNIAMAVARAIITDTAREGVEGAHKLDTASQVFFYEQDFYVLSNFSAFSLEWDGLRFDTSEAAYHYEKFNGLDWELCDLICTAPSAHEAFKLAEKNKDKRRLDWDDIKVDIMRGILRAKAAQHEYVRRKLLATGDRELIEDSWRDSYWGWGPNRDGQNMLGKLWMEVRSELRAAAPSNVGTGEGA